MNGLEATVTALVVDYVIALTHLISFVCSSSSQQLLKRFYVWQFSVKTLYRFFVQFLACSLCLMCNLSLAFAINARGVSVMTFTSLLDDYYSHFTFSKIPRYYVIMHK